MAKKKKQTVQSSIRLAVDLRKRIGQEIERRKFTPEKITLDAVVHEALEDWYAKQRGGARLVPVKVKKKSAVLSAETEKCLQMCQHVLGCNDDEILKAVTSNLRVFFRYTGGDPDDVETTVKGAEAE